MLLSHEDLVLELPKLEKLNASERKRLNDNRRAAQLERWKKSQGEGMCLSLVKSCTFSVVEEILYFLFAFLIISNIEGVN